MRNNPVPITSSYSAVAALNANFTDVANLLEKCLFRDGTAPNYMQTSLDLNHNRVVNVANGVNDTDAANLGQIKQLAINGGAMVITNETAFPRRFSYGPKNVVKTLRKAYDAADTISSSIVGYAAGTTGGNGKTKYVVENESQDPYEPHSYYWALAQARANGGGIIVFDPRGHLNITITDTTHRLDFNNLTIIAPGRNVTFWHAPLLGSTVVTGQNIIIAYIEFRTLPGMIANVNSEGGKVEQKLVNVDPHLCDNIAFVGCEFRHSSDGACDITNSLLVAASPQCRVTVQDFIFWHTDQPMMVGSGDPLCTATDPALLKLTLHNGIFAYCGQRQPKILGRCTVDMSQVFTVTLPFQRDQLSPTNEFGSCYGMAAMFGGTGTARECLWSAADGVTGYAATLIDSVANGASVMVDGAVQTLDSAVENGMTTTNANTSRIPALTYTLLHTPIPAAGPLREAWIAQRWATCGARVDSAPEGIFTWSSDTSFYPDGEDVLIDRALGGRWVRIDSKAEFAKQNESEEVVLAANNYTPTLTAVTNCSGLTVSRASYMQLGKWINVSVVVAGTLTTTAVSTSIGISLPVASDLTVTSDVEGSCRTISSSNQVGGYVNADSTNDRAQATITPTTATGAAFTVSLNFRYMLP